MKKKKERNPFESAIVKDVEVIPAVRTFDATKLEIGQMIEYSRAKNIDELGERQDLDMRALYRGVILDFFPESNIVVVESGEMKSKYAVFNGPWRSDIVSVVK